MTWTYQALMQLLTIALVHGAAERSAKHMHFGFHIVPGSLDLGVPAGASCQGHHISGTCPLFEALPQETVLWRHQLDQWLHLHLCPLQAGQHGSDGIPGPAAPSLLASTAC